jgi:hypothetical protein
VITKLAEDKQAIILATLLYMYWLLMESFTLAINDQKTWISGVPLPNEYLNTSLASLN